MLIPHQTLFRKGAIHISRLQRAEQATLRDRESIIRYCLLNNIPFTTDFLNAAAPAEIMAAFQAGYRFQPLPLTTLSERGSNVVLVMETKYPGNLHGEVVSSIAAMVGSQLNFNVRVLYLHGSINPTYRQRYERETHKRITRLMENLGPSVIHTSIGFEDIHLIMDSLVPRSHDHHLGDVTAFVVDSAGNDGKYGSDGKFIAAQKHNAVSHSPPLVVHVGAAHLMPDLTYHIAGYSSANSPTFVAPIIPEVKLKWRDDKEAEPVLGTSSAAPFVSAGLAALNDIYGRYLTREQILYAVIATCEKIYEVDAFGLKTPQSLRLSYIKNAAGHEYNAEYAGFGLVNFYKAEELLCHMVAYAQAHPEQITIPEETSIRLNPSTYTTDDNGNYRYSFEMPEGISLKTVLSLAFYDKTADVIKVKSPSGVEYPIVLSRLLDKFGISTTHAWAGEQMQGVWEITSNKPIKTLNCSAHHFQARDLIKDVSYNQVAGLSRPDLSRAKTVVEHLGLPTHWIAHAKNDETPGLTIDGVRPEIDTPEATLHFLQVTPDGIKNRSRIFTPIRYGAEGGQGWQIETKAYGIIVDADEKRLEKIELFLQAATQYEADERWLQAANNYSMAAQEWRSHPHFEDSFGKFASENAVNLFQRAIAIHEKLGHYDHMYRDMDRVFSAITDTARGYRMRCETALAEKYEIMAEEIILKINDVASKVEGVKDFNAHRIEEGEAGFSAQAPIGTDRVSQCLTLIVQHAEAQTKPDGDKKTGIVHIDYEIDLDTLSDFFARFPEGPLKMRVVGARFDGDVRSLENIVNVMKQLKNRNIDIISADTWGGDKGPSAVVVYPETFEIYEAVPAIPNPNYDISNAIVLFTSNGKPIIVDFDLTISDARAPIVLDKKATTMMRDEYLGKGLIEIDNTMHRYNVGDKALMIGHLRGLMKAYEKALKPLEDALERRIEYLGSSLSNPQDEIFAEARRLLRYTPLYLGEGADEANRPIVSAINRLLYIKDRQLHLDASQLLDYEPSPNAYKAINDQAGMLKFAKRDVANTGTPSAL